ncbi:MAG: dienelactone hydrolase family protein [Deltaproteobacteria bacterium]|nr:dienelactone hydrolase family protein [Deltaproteobacteria bacterium]MBW2446381.1 dienelactone hydrolase family protein [Deltaproteobacteria bacterium]
MGARVYWLAVETQAVEHGFLAHPSVGGPHPGVVLIPDVRGLYDHFRQLAARLAGEGFAVLAVDLYRRGGPPEITSPGVAMKWIAELPDPQVLGDLQAAIDFLSRHSAVSGRPVGITGFCMGGQYSILAACTCTGLAACAPFYGMLAYPPGLDAAKKPRSPLDAAADLSTPLLGFYGEADPLIPVDDVEAFRGRLAATKQPTEVRVYAGAGHAFMNDAQPHAYHAESAADAWPRLVRFLREQLATKGDDR